MFDIGFTNVSNQVAEDRSSIPLLLDPALVDSSIMANIRLKVNRGELVHEVERGVYCRGIINVILMHVQIAYAV
jgi:hypothetical protein